MITTTFDELMGGKTTLATLIADRLEAIDIDDRLIRRPSTLGICSIVLDVLHELNVPKELFSLVRSRITPELNQSKDDIVWTEYPHYSGNPDYPLPAPDIIHPDDDGQYYGRLLNHYLEQGLWDVEATEAYCAFHALDRWHGEYGSIRLDALQWLIDYLRANPDCLSIKVTV